MRTPRIASLLLIGSLAACPLMVGCDSGPGDKVQKQQEKTTTDSNGNQTTTEQKTVRHSDGSVTTEKHTDSNNTNPRP